jgi:hypothetical protein
MLRVGALLGFATATLSSSAFGITIGPWERTTSFPLAAYQYDAVEYNGYLYVIGGYNSGDGAFSTAYFVKVNLDGTLNPWTETTSLPEPDQGPGVTAYNGWIYTALGNGHVYRSQTSSDGTLGPWIAEATAADHHGGRLMCEANNGYLYIFGGWVDSTFYDDVYVAQINADGSLRPWSTTTPMPQGRQHQSVHFFHGRVYIAGGITDGLVILNSVYSAPVFADGTLGAWRQEADIPTPLWYHNSVLVDGQILLFGGRTDYCSGETNTIYAGAISLADGAISQWLLVDTMPSEFVLAPGAVQSLGSGMVYLIGGAKGCCTCGSEFTSDVWRALVSEHNCSGDPGFALTVPAEAPIGEFIDICTSAPAGDGIALMASLGQGPTVTPFGTLCLDFPPLVVFTFVMPGSGNRCFHRYVVCDPNSVGVTGYLQFIALKPAGGVDGLSNQGSIIVVDHAACG